MKITIEGTKEEMMDLLKEIRKRDSLTVPSSPNSPIPINPCPYERKPWWATETTPIRTITRPEDIKTTTTGTSPEKIR